MNPVEMVNPTPVEQPEISVPTDSVPDKRLSAYEEYCAKRSARATYIRSIFGEVSRPFSPIRHDILDPDEWSHDDCS